MKSFVVCEKPDQKKKIMAAVGNQFGAVIPFVGHIARLLEPEEENPAWKVWNDDILIPQRGFYKTVIEQKHKSILNQVKAEAAKCDTAIIATDLDREGQLIAQEVLDLAGFKGKLLRAVFTALDKKSLEKAFNNLQDNAKYEGWYQAGQARQQTDQIFNLSLTRIVTNNLKKPYSSRKPIGIGRVKTPVTGIVCKIEDEIINFKAEAYWTIAATVQGSAGQIVLKHGGNPTSANFLKTEDYAKEVAKEASKYSGPIGIKKERKEKTPPRPFDFTSLSSVTSSAFGMSMDKTLEIAQSLYEKHEITTYPRTECRYIGEIMIPDANIILNMLKNIPEYSKYGLISPIIRKGKSGVFCDEIVDKASHHAIIPNIGIMGSKSEFMKVYGSLNETEKKVFDLISRQYLAAIGENSKYDSTEASINVVHNTKDHIFIARGQVTTFPGFLEILKNVEADDEENDKIPAFKDKDPVKTTAIKILTEETKPPSRLSEGQLGVAMKEAWKYIDNPEERAKLKETEGIGTAATRAGIIKTLKAQNILAISGKKIVPSPGAMEMYYVMKEHTPELLDIGATARMEKILDGISDGKFTVQQAINDTCKRMKPLIEKIQTVSKTVKIDMSVQVVSKGRGRSKKASGTNPAPTQNTNSGYKPKSSGSSGKIDGTKLNIPFDKKDEGKSLGARWNADAKCWYAPKGVNIDEFKKKGWLA